MGGLRLAPRSGCGERFMMELLIFALGVFVGMVIWSALVDIDE
jgi:hypothetical protein